MTLLIVGVVLWSAIHFFKRVTPDLRAQMDEKMGAGPARGVISLIIVASLLMMIIGYRAAGHEPVYAPIEGIGHLNNLLMLIAVVMMGMGKSKGVIRTWVRHFMLSGVALWAVAHLLVNGDLASIILFGGMLAWAVIQMVLINRAEGAWQRPKAGPISADIKPIVIGLVVFAVFAGVHIGLGYNPFLGTYG